MLLSWVILCASVFGIYAQVALVSRTEFWRMLWQTGIPVGDWLYIDETHLASKPAVHVILNQTLSDDLSKSRTTSSVTLNTIEKPGSYATIRWPSLWLYSTSNEIYSFGGEPSQIGTELSVWALSPDGRGGGR
jgi:hypothetical protein